MRQYGELRMSSYYTPDRDWELRNVRCSFVSSDDEHTSLPGSAPSALTRLAQDGWGARHERQSPEDGGWSPARSGDHPHDGAGCSGRAAWPTLIGCDLGHLAGGAGGAAVTCTPPGYPQAQLNFFIIPPRLEL